MFNIVIMQAIFRHILTVVAGLLVSKGLLPGGDSADFITGILTLLAGGGLSAMQKDSMIGALYGLIRHALTFAAGFLVSQGWISPELSTQLVMGIMSLIIGGTWSIKDKTGTGRA